jgi:hypothetical protein
MPQEYIIQKWLDGKARAWRRLSANIELEAAERVTGMKFRTIGKLGELRARVRVVGDLQKEFPDLAAIKAWYNSPEYAPLLAMRQPAATISLPLKRREKLAMSAIGPKRTSKTRSRMSAFGGKADIANPSRHVRL